MALQEGLDAVDAGAEGVDVPGRDAHRRQSRRGTGRAGPGSPGRPARPPSAGGYVADRRPAPAPAAVVATSVTSPARRWKKDCSITQPMIPSRSRTVRVRVLLPLPTTRWCSVSAWPRWAYAASAQHGAEHGEERDGRPSRSQPGSHSRGPSEHPRQVEHDQDDEGGQRGPLVPHVGTPAGARTVLGQRDEQRPVVAQEPAARRPSRPASGRREQAGGAGVRSRWRGWRAPPRRPGAAAPSRRAGRPRTRSSSTLIDRVVTRPETRCREPSYRVSRRPHHCSEVAHGREPIQPTRATVNQRPPPGARRKPLTQSRRSRRPSGSRTGKSSSTWVRNAEGAHDDDQAGQAERGEPCPRRVEPGEQLRRPVGRVGGGCRGPVACPAASAALGWSAPGGPRPARSPVAGVYAGTPRRARSEVRSCSACWTVTASSTIRSSSTPVPICDLAQSRASGAAADPPDRRCGSGRAGRCWSSCGAARCASGTAARRAGTRWSTRG